MPKSTEQLSRGTRLYRCWNSVEPEVVTFLFEERVETMVCQGADGRRFCCSKSMYVASRREAIEKYLGECEAAIESARKGLEEMRAHLEFVEAETERARAALLNVAQGDEE